MNKLNFVFENENGKISLSLKDNIDANTVVGVIKKSVAALDPSYIEDDFVSQEEEEEEEEEENWSEISIDKSTTEKEIEDYKKKFENQNEFDLLIHSYPEENKFNIIRTIRASLSTTIVKAKKMLSKEEDFPTMTLEKASSLYAELKQLGVFVSIRPKNKNDVSYQ